MTEAVKEKKFVAQITVNVEKITSIAEKKEVNTPIYFTRDGKPFIFSDQTFSKFTAYGRCTVWREGNDFYGRLNYSIGKEQLTDKTLDDFGVIPIYLEDNEYAQKGYINE